MRDDNVEILPYTDDTPIDNPFSGAVCLHCMTTLSITTENEYDYGMDLCIVHPPTEKDSHRYSIRLNYIGQTQKFGSELGKWLRETVHPEPKKIEIPEPMYTEATPHAHLLEVLRPLIGPHLEAIGVTLHVTEALETMQQWTVDITDDCGFEMEVVFRVKRTGSCFDAIRRRSYVSNRDSVGEQQTSGSHTHSETELSQCYTPAEQDALLRREGDSAEPGSDSERRSILSYEG